MPGATTAAASTTAARRLPGHERIDRQRRLERSGEVFDDAGRSPGRPGGAAGAGSPRRYRRTAGVNGIGPRTAPTAVEKARQSPRCSDRARLPDPVSR
jgi:hypothetical protein